MKKILIIDSHKGTKSEIPTNLHWQNAKIISDYLGADLIWSYPSVNDNIKENYYDIIILNHSSFYSYISNDWVIKNPDSKIFYILNEYSVGESDTLWYIVKNISNYQMIANFPMEGWKTGVKKYVDKWHMLNLNSLIYNPKKQNNNFFDIKKMGCVYYGSFRKDRKKYFKKYLTTDVLLSTHSKNVHKFRSCGVSSHISNRIDWNKAGLSLYNQSLYIEDERTHIHYNHLANRFYEALNYNCTPIFSEECKRTTELSGYNIPDEYFINDSCELKNKLHLNCLDEWNVMALEEKNQTLKKIKEIILN